MKKPSNLKTELKELRTKIAELEQIESKHKEIEAELMALNQQLDATNQQLQASEQQLKAYNQQLKISEKQIKQQKEEAQNAREFAENIIDTVRQPLLVLDADLKVITANRYFYKLFQVSAKNTIGVLLYSLGNGQWNIPQLKDLLKQTLQKKSTVEDYEVEHNFEDIGTKTMLLNARELRQQKGKQRLILLAIEDITQQKEAKRKLNQLNKELQRKADELQQILYITTHDLRSPLVNIEGFTKEMKASINELENLLAKTELTEDLKEDVNRIMKDEVPEAVHFITSSTTKMDNLLKGLLALSRLGRQKLTFQKLDMNKLMREVLDNYKFEIDQNKINIATNDLPSCVGDELQINQLFSNLIGNSIKFLKPDETGKIRITGSSNKKGSTYVVEDNGIGISREHQEKVFGLFEKLDHKKPGIGLGLNIIKQIVEKHNGTIKLESKLGEGTKFIIFIPH